jgi:hypothetical protein
MIPMEQPDFEPGFKLRHVSADRALRDVQFPRRQREVHRSGRHFERTQSIQWRQPAAHGTTVDPQENSSRR